MNNDATIAAFKEKFKDDLPKPVPLQPQDGIEQYHQEVEKHKRNIRNQLYYQLRRYNITHHEFPQKYRELFNETRNEYLTCYLLESIDTDEAITKELSILYGFIRERLFQSINSKSSIENAKLAQSLLHSIAAVKKGK